MSLFSGAGSLFAQQGVQAIAAGVLSGAVAGGALVATGVIPVGGSAAPPATVEIRACPDAGAVLGELTDGQTLLVTGRSADGTWLELYIGQPGVERGWAPATSLHLETSGDGLPVAECVGPSPAPLPSPIPSLTAVESVTPEASVTPSVSIAPAASAIVAPTPTPTPTPRPTPRVTPKITPKPTPTASPMPTPTPDAFGPTISNLTISGALNCGGAFEGQFCIFPSPPCGPPSSATISITATDPSGVIDANLWYRFGTSGGYSAVGMSHNGDQWSGTISATSPSSAIIEYFWETFDSFGNQSNLNYTSDRILRQEACIL